jgi:hypothetical protein
MADVLELVWRLEAQGVRFSLDADGRHLEVGPKDALEPVDFRQVWQMRHEVARIVRYCQERRWESTV